MYYLNKYAKVAESNLTEEEKKNSNMEIMEAENRKMKQTKKIANIHSSGHTRNFKSADEGSAKPFKGLTKDYTAPNLGGFERSQRF